MVAQAFGADTALAAVRGDLTITNAGRDISGVEGILLHDRLRHRFFRLPAFAAAMLEHWHLGKAGEVASRSGTSLADVEELNQFLGQARLTVVPSGGIAALMQERQRGEHSLVMQGVHNYLFFRIPLFDPTRFLDSAMPLARMLFGRLAISIIAVLGLVGLFLASRQWDQFAATFLDFLSPQGLLLYGITLVFLKVAHEFGHGFMARHFGCRVPVIGVAFMLLAPMLYTETTDAWRLPARRQRILIDAAGMLVEVALAAAALFLWAFLPDGPARAAAFFVCTTALVMSFLVNLSPFMRFDGYHILADFLGAHNLGPRSFALGRWKMREMLFGLGQTAPEMFPRHIMWFLVIYAWATWIYRLGLFAGIAVLVYYMFPKAIGIPMFGIEIAFFIALPIIRELKDWMKMDRKSLVASKVALRTLLVVSGLIVLALLPLDRSMQVPAVLLAPYEANVFPPEAGQVEEVLVRPGQAVQAGDVLLKLASPKLSHELEMVSLRLDIVEGHLSRVAADERERAAAMVLARERAALEEERAGLLARQDLLTIRAARQAVVTGMMDGLQPGIWVGGRSLLFHLAGQQGAQIVGLGSVLEVDRLVPGAQARFVGEDGLSAMVAAELTSIGAPVTSGVEFTYLSSLNGGPIGMARDPQTGESAPITGVLPVRFATAVLQAPTRSQRGVVTVAARPESLMGQALGRLVAIFLRESGF